VITGNDCHIGLAQSTVDATSLSTCRQHLRALIFCHLKSMLDIVEKDMFKGLLLSVRYLKFDGSVPATNWQTIVNWGVGVNLTIADTAIFVEHDWNPMKKLQVMDRAHLSAKRKSLTSVNWSIVWNTFAEKIMGLPNFEMNIAKTVISEHNRNFESMGTDQLLSLFNLDNSNTGFNSSAGTASSTLSNRNTKAFIEGMEELWDSQY